MTRLFRSAVLAVALAVSLELVAAPQDAPTLKPGDPAPKLFVAEWVKGKPVEALKKGHVYVVEFWATWCGPCIAGMPHLSEVQKEWGPKGLTVISVTSEDPRNSLDSVKTMVEEKGDVMSYTVAWDDGQKTKDAWFRAAGQRGIPCAFVVDKKGTLAWVGHPMWLDTVVDKVSAGTWDVKRDVENLAKAPQRINEMLSAAREPKTALAKFDELAADFPKVATNYETFRFAMLLDLKRYKDAGALGTKIVQKANEAKNARDLNTVAQLIVDPNKDRGGRGLKLALKASLAANRITDGEIVAYLHTLARVHFTRGDVEKAIKVQKRAVKKARGTRNERPASAALAEYEAAAEKKSGE